MSTLLEIVWKGMQSGHFDADELPALTLDDAQRLQLQVLETYLKGREKLAGYKVGLTSGTSRNAFGEGIRPFGYILKSRVFSSGATVDATAVGTLGLENELVFRMGADLTGRDVTAADARRAVESVAPGFEINQARTSGAVSQGLRVAENLSQWGIVTGEFTPPESDLSALSVSLSVDGKGIAQVAARDHIDDHYESIATLARALHKHKRHLRQGAFVITGSFTRITPATPGCYIGDFGSLGTVSVNITGEAP